MKKRFNSHRSLIAVIFTALAAAMSVVLCRFVGFSPMDSPVRIEFGFLPIAVLAEMLGPVFAGIGYLTADVVGSFVQGYAPNPYIALCKLATGIIMGLVFSHSRTSLVRIIVTFSIINVLVDFLLMSPIFVYMYGYTWGTTFAIRAVNAAATLPVRIVTFYITAKALTKPIARFRRIY